MYHFSSQTLEGIFCGQLFQSHLHAWSPNTLLNVLLCLLIRLLLQTFKFLKALNWKAVNSDSSILFRLNPYVIWKNYTALHCKKSDLITHMIFTCFQQISLYSTILLFPMQQKIQKLSTYHNVSCLSLVF